MKRCLFLVLLLGVSLSAFAKPVSLGFKFGPNMAMLNSSYPDNRIVQSSRIVGWSGSITADVPVWSWNKHWISLRGEASVVQKGGKDETTRTDTLRYPYTIKDTTYTRRIDEFCLAPYLVADFYLGGGSFYLEAGPEFGFLIHQSQKVAYTNQVKFSSQGTWEISSTGSETHPIPYWQNTGISLNLGAGGTIPVGPGRVVFGVRGNIGLNERYLGKYWVDQNSKVLGKPSLKTSGLLLLFGYDFPVGGKD